uniref:Uncharacterized protein n=1 Tax=Lactuca sativa TaxID=4236 RepID=A0A9R1VWM9_LACSA|nr:hypothetical protein LSAT_V11C400222420 [Lactuca sativa]
MKQNRKGKHMFEGKYPLVKFGQFAEVSSVSDTKSSSVYEETEDEVITAFEHEEQHVAPMEIVAEEHVLVTDVEKNDDENANDDDDESDFQMNLMDNVVNEDEGEDDMDQGEDLNCYDNDDLFFGCGQDQDIRLSIKDLDAFFDNVNEVA